MNVVNEFLSVFGKESEYGKLGKQKQGQKDGCVTSRMLMKRELCLIQKHAEQIANVRRNVVSDVAVWIYSRGW